MHTKWSDGSNTILEMAEAAQKLGHEYICITDHIGNFRIANALDEKRIKKQKKEIDIINKKLRGIVVLHGCEVNIKDDGSIDMKDSVLKELDVVLASIHSGFKNPKDKLTKRIAKAMENGNVDIIAHPTGRLLNERPPYDIDFDELVDKAKSTKTVLEINAHPNRLALSYAYAKAALKKGIKLSIGTDSHDVHGLRNYRLGIATARKAWARKEDIINTFPLEEMKKHLK